MYPLVPMNHRTTLRPAPSHRWPIRKQTAPPLASSAAFLCVRQPAERPPERTGPGAAPVLSAPTAAAAAAAAVLYSSLSVCRGVRICPSTFPPVRQPSMQQRYIQGRPLPATAAGHTTSQRIIHPLPVRPTGLLACLPALICLFIQHSTRRSRRA
ncbi:hypothetical protein CC78DRAFT_542969 [Lojkania enalia]|uniref:Uncharacterized protein n=1 Tax=Lojkania enalia TaxID=147567 RepID=A0A9P4N4H3_9PLEO|nr:hypothetical protein CC78DRAFT_542969 [Didymosphaeria enalia]